MSELSHRDIQLQSVAPQCMQQGSPCPPKMLQKGVPAGPEPAASRDEPEHKAPACAVPGAVSVPISLDSQQQAGAG